MNYMNETNLEFEVVNALKSAKKTLAVAESCTGGLISKRITDVAGASEIYLGGVVAYANEVKTALLGVDPETLKKFGAVSEQTAAEMARGVRLRLGSDIGISTTGIAGPGGGTPEKPVGLVYIGVSTKEKTSVITLHIPESKGRKQTRCESSNQALTIIKSLI